MYAIRMGLQPEWGGAHPPEYDLDGRAVLDIGGGPVSLLLKCRRRGRSVVVDPGAFPTWIAARYAECGIQLISTRAEDYGDVGDEGFDEAWIYNVLQHVDDPARVVANARAAARKAVRVFEWVNVAPYPGHPHTLTSELLDGLLAGHGYVARLDEHGCVGEAYYGVFPAT